MLRRGDVDDAGPEDEVLGCGLLEQVKKFHRQHKWTDVIECDVHLYAVHAFTSLVEEPACVVDQYIQAVELRLVRLRSRPRSRETR